MLQTILIALVTVNIFALHAQPAFTHFQNSYIHQQTTVTNNPTFDKQFDDIRAQVDQISAGAKNNTNLVDLSNKVANIKTSVTELQTILNQFQLQIVTGVQKCPRVSTFNRTAIRQSIVKVETSEKDSLNYVNGRSDCDFAKPGLNRILNLSDSFVGFLNSSLDGKFCTSDKVLQEKPVGLVNINGNQFKTNLKAKNWYYGSTTASDYKIALFKLSIVYNLTDCPLELPFLDKTKKCSNCQNGAVFNLGTQSCDSCQPKQILNIEKGLCQVCLGDKLFVDGKLTCVPCLAADGKFYNATSDKCEVCSGKSYVDPNTKNCISINCSSTTPRFNTTTLKCEACGVSQQIDPNNITQCRKTNYIGLCHPTLPKYDVATKTCVACPTGTVYNSNNNECQAPKASHFSQKMGQLHEAEVVVNRKCQKGFVFVFRFNGCFPLNKTCGQHQFYNEKEGKCYMLSLRCKRDEKYNKKTHICQKVNTTCQAGYVFNFFSLTCKKSVQCKPDEQLNAKFHVCEKKKLICEKGQVIDYKTKTCVVKHFITNPYHDKLSYAGDFKNYVKYYDTVKASDKLTTDCPNKTPFYHKRENTCISCPQKTPIFDLTNDKCSACKYNQYYSVYEHKCLDEKKKLSNIPSTVDRMNI